MTEFEEAASPETSPDRLAALAEHDDVKVRAGAIANPNFPPELLGIMLDDDSWYVRAFGVAEHPRISIELLDALSRDQSQEVRSQSAKHSDMPVDVLIRLSRDESLFVRSSVASNSSTPTASLSDLAADPEALVRRSAASNSNTPSRILGLLASDSDKGVRAAVATNPSASQETLQLLSRDPDLWVNERAIMNPNFVRELAKRPSSPATPEDLRRLIRSGGIDCFTGAAVAISSATKSHQALPKMMWLQASLSEFQIWPSPGFDGFHIDYLDLMWNAFRAAAAISSEREGDDVLVNLMKTTDIWENPVTPAAIVLTCPLSANVINDTLDQFLTISADVNMARAAPLTAALSLRPESNVGLAVRTAKATSEGNWKSPYACPVFWEFVTGYVNRGSKDADWWCPFPWWRDGYFDVEGISIDPRIGYEQVRALTELLHECPSFDWDWTNPHGEATALGTTLLALGRWSQP